MTDGTITTAEIDQYKSYIGRTVEQTDYVDAHVAIRLAATLDADLPTSELPPLWHYGLFLPSIGTSLLNIDGHPRRGDFLPPVRLPRRMFAGSALKFIRPVAIGQVVSRVSKVAAVDHRNGKTGDLVFVRVAMTLSQADSICIEEEQTVVYRPAGAKTPPVKSIARVPLTLEEISEAWVPTTTELFRYSASTFNAHRVHYDRPYVLEEEGYPDLLVHGPLIATRLCHFAAKVTGGELSSFIFRSEAPSFVAQEIRFVGTMKNGGCTVRAERADGVVAMSGIAFCREHAEEFEASTIAAALCIP